MVIGDAAELSIATALFREEAPGNLLRLIRGNESSPRRIVTEGDAAGSQGNRTNGERRIDACCHRGLLTMKLSGRPRCLGRGQTRPTHAAEGTSYGKVDTRWL